MWGKISKISAWGEDTRRINLKTYISKQITLDCRWHHYWQNWGKATLWGIWRGLLSQPLLLLQISVNCKMTWVSLTILRPPSLSSSSLRMQVTFKIALAVLQRTKDNIVLHVAGDCPMSAESFTHLRLWSLITQTNNKWPAFVHYRLRSGALGHLLPFCSLFKIEFLSLQTWYSWA